MLQVLTPQWSWEARLITPSRFHPRVRSRMTRRHGHTAPLLRGLTLGFLYLRTLRWDQLPRRGLTLLVAGWFVIAMASMLFALFLATFAIATTEFAVVGLLPDIAINLGVGIPTAGLLVSAYAVGVAVGGPVLVVATTSMTKKNALLLFMAIFVIGHVLSALAFSYTFLLVSRIVAA